MFKKKNKYILPRKPWVESLINAAEFGAEFVKFVLVIGASVVFVVVLGAVMNAI